MARLTPLIKNGEITFLLVNETNPFYSHPTFDYFGVVVPKLEKRLFFFL